MQKQISTELTVENIQEVIRQLAESPVKLKKICKGKSEKQLQEPIGHGERSFTEVVAHILNCEAITADSIYLALLLKEPMIASIHAERDLGKLFQLEEMPIADLLAYFNFRRALLLKVLGSLKPTQWSRMIREEGKQRKESVYWRARGQALHEHEHLLDLEAKLK